MKLEKLFGKSAHQNTDILCIPGTIIKFIGKLQLTELADRQPVDFVTPNLKCLCSPLCYPAV